MKQRTFTDFEYENRKHKTKREEFLDIMDEIIPWNEWIVLIEPHYFKGKRGRPPMGIEKMLRMYLLQVWFSLSDMGVEDAIYDSYAMRKFMGINFQDEQVPNSTTLLKFRRIMEEHKIGEVLFNAIRDAFDKAGVMMRGGTIVDATLISAPSSTKNAKHERDPEMHQTKKGGQWYFGMKIHSGVDAATGYVHTIEATSANVHDVEMAPKLIRKNDDVVYGDSGYLGIAQRAEVQSSEHLSKIDYRINRRPSQLKTPDTYKGINWDKEIERQKSSVRCKVEHPFLIVKRFFGYRKTVYRGLAKNLNRFHVLFGCANLLAYARAGNRTMPTVG